MNKKYVALLQDAESHTVVNVTAGTYEASVPNVEPHTVRLAGETDHGTKFGACHKEAGSKLGDSWWRKTHQRQRVEDSRCRKLCGSREWVTIRQSSRKRGKAWEHHVGVHENLTASKLDDNVNIGVLLRQVPPKLRNNVLVKSYQFESTYNKLRAITHAYLNFRQELDCE